MNILKSTPLLSTLVAGILLATPATGFCDRKITVVRDRDGDGHYNKKTYEVPDRRYRGNYGGNYRGNYRGSYYGNRPYYGGYRPYYGSGFYARPSVSVVYRQSPTVYSGYAVADDLGVDVQRELRRRGYYRGSIDGDVGPGTRAAIRNYQSDRGLAVTGRIDSRLLRSLGVS